MSLHSLHSSSHFVPFTVRFVSNSLRSLDKKASKKFGRLALFEWSVAEGVCKSNFLRVVILLQIWNERFVFKIYSLHPHYGGKSYDALFIIYAININYPKDNNEMEIEYGFTVKEMIDMVKILIHNRSVPSLSIRLENYNLLLIVLHIYVEFYYIVLKIGRQKGSLA